jgi:hypothetical protein
MRHGWSPLTITDGGGQGSILIDLTEHLTAVEVGSDAHGALVTAQTGVSMTQLLTELEDHGYGLAACPAPGDLSLGGVLAIDGHGTVIPVAGEASVPGQTFGTLSNLITELTAIVWDGSQGTYVARGYSRADAEMSAPHGRHRGHALRGARGRRGREFRGARRAVRPDRDDLVPLHAVAVAEAVERRAGEARDLARDVHAVQLHLLRRDPRTRLRAAQDPDQRRHLGHPALRAGHRRNRQHRSARTSRRSSPRPTPS